MDFSSQDFLEYFLPVLNAYNIMIVFYFLLVNVSYSAMLLRAFVAIRRHLRFTKLVELKKIFRSPFFKPVSIIVPAYNEEFGIVDSLKSLLQIQYPLFEIIVVDDGSTDGTFRRLTEEFHLYRTETVFRKSLDCKEVKGVYMSRDYPNLIVIDKINGGKADAMNAGINASNYPLFCAIDADSVLEPDVLLRIVRPFIEDPKTVGAGGTVRISNGCSIKNGYVRKVGLPTNLWGKFQILEYLRAFLAGRVAFSSVDCLLIISGAFGIFKKDAVVSVGGYKQNALGEDMELVVRLHKQLTLRNVPYKIVFIPEPVCWTEAPETLKVLGHQRKRWQRGLLESLTDNSDIFFNRKYGLLGFIIFPFFLLVEGIGCFVESFGLFVFGISYYFGLVDNTLALVFLFGGVVLNIFLSLGAILFEEFTLRRYPALSDILILSLLSLLEIFLYKPINVWWRLVGSFQFLTNSKQNWGDMEKKGFKSETKPSLQKHSV